MASRRFSIDSRDYSPRRCLVIAEIGTAHGGDPEKGRELVAAAVEAGADCVKFQHVYADEIIHPKTGLVPLPGGDVSLYDRFKALETPAGFLGRMKAEAESRGALFLCTPFGERSARELRDLGVAAMKIASPELNYVQLVGVLASYGLPTLLSSGVSMLSDIDEAVRTFRAGTDAPLALLHCVTAYPAPESDYNLRALPPLATLFDVAVGVSDHSLDPILVPSLAVASGACAIEKHICLSRSGDGLDDPIALTPGDFARMVGAVRTAGAEEPSATVGRLSAEHGPARIESILGDGVKRLAPSEQANYARTNRSLHARRPIRKGEALGPENVAVLRTEKVLRPGLHPRFLALALGRVAARDIPDGEGVEWDDIGGLRERA